MKDVKILHYTYTKFSDVKTRRDRCDCAPIQEDLKGKCFFLEFDTKVNYCTFILDLAWVYVSIIIYPLCTFFESLLIQDDLNGKCFFLEFDTKVNCCTFILNLAWVYVQIIIYPHCSIFESLFIQDDQKGKCFFLEFDTRVN